MRAARSEVHREPRPGSGGVAVSRRGRERDERTWGRNPIEVAIYLATAPLLRGLARLPLSALYRVSDVAFWLVYHVLRLRRSVARDNLRRSFPNVARDELDRIEERCYRNQCDVAAEWLKLMTMSADEIRERVQIDFAIARELLDRHQSAIFVLGHCGNWEWAIPRAVLAFPEAVIHVIYHPIRHAGFDRLIRSVRARFGGMFTPHDRAPRAIVRLRSELAGTFLVADQRAHGRNPYLTRFLGQQTAFVRGPERLARSLDVPVVYVAIRRVERGRYAVDLEWLCEDPSTTSDGEITERFARRLEQQVQKAPDDWLWLHRRWRDRRAERSGGSRVAST
jgi:KDO2-lipid IV(A) lauroyltransferase